MKKIFSKNSAAGLISICLLCAGIAIACSGDDGYEYRVSNFTPEVFVKASYSPFLYSNMFYYKIGHDEDQNKRFNEDNVTAWSGWLKSVIPHKELVFFLQKASPTEIDSVSQYVNGKLATWPHQLKGFVTERKNKIKKICQFFNYLQLAKTSEGFAVNEIQYAWDYDSTKRFKKFDVGPLNDSLEKEFIAADDIFLKERYWFQLERSYFYKGSFREIKDFFDQNEKFMPRNTLYWRTLAYLAGAYYKKKAFGKANYYYSRVYDNCDVLKTTAHFSFHPQEEKDWKETLSLCKNADEQATLWQMLGVRYSDEIRSIHEIYKLDPKNSRLDLLLSRAVNKYEQKFKPKDAAESMRDMTAGYSDSIKKMIFQIAHAGLTAKPWIWNLASAYLNTLDLNYSQANAYFEQAAKTIPSGRLAQMQIRLLKLINKVGAAKKIDARFENEVLPDIQWLKGSRDYDWGSFRREDALEWIKKDFAEKYSSQGEWAKSECFVSHKGFYADQKKLELMKDFLARPSKSPYQQLCVSLSDIQLKDIYEYEAIKLTYKDSIHAAIEKMSRAKGGALTILLGNPFNTRIKDCHDCDFLATQKVKYSKIAFLKKIEEIRGKKIINGAEIYNNTVLLGNAFYNMSQYGNARVFYECKVLGQSHSNPEYIEEAYRPMLLSMNMAVKYYDLALGLARTDEEKAKSLYLLAKCQRNQWYNQNVYNGQEIRYGENPMVNLNVLDGFNELSKYAKTQYYKEVIRECGYYRMYIKNNPPGVLK